MAEFRPSVLSFEPGEAEVPKIKQVRVHLDLIEQALLSGEEMPRWAYARFVRCSSELETLASMFEAMEARRKRKKP